jgi:hypothetical protein
MPLDAALALGRYLFLGLLTVLLWQLYGGLLRDLRATRPDAAPGRESPAAAAREPRLVVARGTGRLTAGQAWLLRAPLTLGRAEDNDVVIEDTYASGHHARLWIENNQVWIEDLGSTNGTLVNRAKIGGRSVLRPGSVVQLGSVTLRLEA